MTASTDNHRKNIISKIKGLPAEKLSLVDTYLDSLAAKEKQKATILSFAGIFKDLDDDVLDDLTVNLPKKRTAQTSDFLKN